MTNVTRWRWPTLQVYTLALVAVSLAGCGSAGGGDDATKSPGSGTSTETEPETNNPPTTNPAANIGAGGALRRVQPENKPWTAGQLAGEIQQSGLVFSDGTEQEPAAVSCVADETSESTDTRFSAFECNVEVPNVPAYTIAVDVAENGEARFEVTETAD